MSNYLIKTSEEIRKISFACQLAREVLEMMTPFVKEGVSTEELDQICHRYITDVQNAIPAPLHYRGFPKSICTSVNEVICHGIPDKRVLKNGDIINIDVTVIKDGYYGDTSRMFMIGDVSNLAKRLVQVTYDAMMCGIKTIRPKARLGDLGAAIQEHTEKNGFSVVREYCGHGIGKHFHEEPNVLHYGVRGTGFVLEPGMVFTVEPMINVGQKETLTLADGWTVVTRDGSLSAQWEHTVLVTRSGYQILT